LINREGTPPSFSTPSTTSGYISLQGWINYYGRFYKSMLYPVFRHFNETLVRWAMRKYKRLRRHKTRAHRFIADVARRQPGLFAHWRWGLRPDGWTMGAG